MMEDIILCEDCEQEAAIFEPPNKYYCLLCHESRTIYG